MSTLSPPPPPLVAGRADREGAPKSTALHLARRGYTSVHIIDAYPIPSAQSAGGGDVNKLAGESLAPEVCGSRVCSSEQRGDILTFHISCQGFRGELSREIMKGWREDPVFKEHYHETGRVSLLAASHLAIVTFNETEASLALSLPARTSRTG